MKYRITGRSRQVAAIGILTKFTCQLQAESHNQAYEKARDEQYNNNRECVLIDKVEVKQGKRWSIVTPDKYLYL